MRRRAWFIAAICLMAWPAAAGANITAVYTDDQALPAPGVCVVGGTTDPVTFNLLDDHAAVLATASVPAPNTTSTACGAGNRFAPTFPGYNNYLAGATIAATQDGVTVTFPVPYASYESTDTDTHGLVRVRNFPNPARLQNTPLSINVAAAPGTLDASGVTTPAMPLTIDMATVDGVPFHAVVKPQRFLLSISSYGSFTVYGVSPLAGPVHVTLLRPDGMTVIASDNVYPKIGSYYNDSYGMYTFGDLYPVEFAGGDVLRVDQPGWFTHSTTTGTLSITNGSFAVALPSDQTGTYNVDLSFLDPAAVAALPASDPLRCNDLGPAVTCAGGGARFSASDTGLYVAAFDSIGLNGTSANGDNYSLEADQSGASAYLPGNELEWQGTPGAAVTATVSRPRPAPLAPLSAAASGTTNSTGYIDFGGRLPFALTSGSTATFSGPAVGSTPLTASFNLTFGLSGNVVSGHTAANSPIQLNDSHGGGVTYYYATADGAGAFSITLAAVTTDDELEVVASDPASHNRVTDRIYAGEQEPQITGIADDQLVHGTITAHAGNLTAGVSGVRWNSDTNEETTTLPQTLSLAAPDFADAIDTTQVPDGVYEVTAAATPAPSRVARIVVRIDNTRPFGGAGADQRVGVGRPVAIVTGAGDANGLASVHVTYGDGAKADAGVSALAAPFSHVYARRGTFTVTVTVTDAAGNVTTDTARVQVVSALSSSVSGRFAATVHHGKNLTAKLTPHETGVLLVQVLKTSGKRKLAASFRFTKSGKAVRETLKTHGLARGTYLLVEQYAASTGAAGPVVVTKLRVT